jgi:3-oxoacyl-[acyl-carrier protein] reductase
MDLGLKGKVAMVAGASRGLGYAVAEALAREGALVAISSSNQGSIDDAARRLSSGGAGVVATAVDVRNGDQIAAWTKKTIDQFGGVDLLMTNAGGPPAGASLSFDDAAWQNAIDLLFFSTLRMVRAAVPSMTQRGGGAILMSTSSSVKEPIANLSLSNVVRSAVSSLCKTLSIELAPEKIRVNQIVPGRIDTVRVRQLDEITAKKQNVTAEQAKGKAVANIPMGRYGEIDEFGRVGAFLLSDAASYVTGATVQVDGGQMKGVF